MIDLGKVESLITKKTCAVIGVHLFGNVCDVKGLEKICNKHKLKLIFDAAHAFGCYLNNMPIGGFGNAEILSFHATKFFNTFEGGAILTNDSELSNRIKFLRNFGFRGYDDVGYLGINGKMSESSAAMGLASLPSLRTRLERLENNYYSYRKYLNHIPGIELLSVGVSGRSNYQYVVVFVDKEKFRVSRDTLLHVLVKENVFARRYFYPGCHRMGPYNILYPNAYKNLPITEDTAERILCLPTGFKNPQKYVPTIVNII